MVSKNVFRFCNEQFSRARVFFLLEQRDFFFCFVFFIFFIIISWGVTERRKRVLEQRSPFVKKIYHTQISKCTANMEKFTLSAFCFVDTHCF